MSPEPLPAQGPEKRMFVVALRQMSDACEMPELTPECPFYELGPRGSAQCGEQCMDLLAQHEEDLKPPQSAALWEHFAALRREPRRSRRPPRDTSPAFDAAQRKLADEDKPTDAKSTTALLVTLVEAVQTPPGWSFDEPERTYQPRAALEELRRRGLPAAEIVAALPDYILSMLLFSLYHDRMTLPGGEPLELPAGDEAWLQVVLAARAADQMTEVDELQYATTSKFQRRFRAWAASVSEDDLIDWTAPTAEGFLAAGIGPSEGNRTGIWLLDRFTKTYVTEWSHESVTMEWAYAHGRLQGCCPARVMHERQIDGEVLSRLVAHRAFEEWQRDTASGAVKKWRLDLSELTRLAVENLRAERFGAAVALFSAAVQVQPDDWRARNNLGFCMLHDDPAEGLAQLELAGSLQKGADLTNLTNRVLALHLLGRDADALALAEAELPNVAGGASHAWLWDYTGPSLMLTGLVDTQAHLDGLLRHIRKDPCPGHATGVPSES